ncbi:phage tail sheath subtilisin-like domain-containing protein [Spirosoma sp. BT702]|uniref:Phage tail sheath subtilisin-like domain-containing protein n=1 Tax=Spirosoma profusum TaxID=2771354 RepID=A0A926XVN3_9BACT|nr:phage tail sheath C-terminal domain-containing protein [Spirosoma profusum]MBD2700750.1 phage tail sheath subtilisin-like domain-containing protein [Spirosoma profusum]
MPTTYSTPGVFVEEQTLFPPSVAAVATAIPAFIGYTAKAQDDSTNQPLNNRPTRLSSLLEYELYFGGDFAPTTYDVVVTNNAITSITPKNGINNRRYYLYKAVRNYFDNGGGPCYVVSVGVYPSPVQIGTLTTDLLGGLDAIRRFDEPTILLFPDAVELPDAATLGTLQKSALVQCADLQDRFVIMDIQGGFQKASVINDPIANFRDNIGTDNLKYGAVYYPWLVSTYVQDLTFSSLAFKKPDPVNAGAVVAMLPADLEALSAVLTDVTMVQQTLRTGADNVLFLNALAGATTPPLTSATISPLKAQFDRLAATFLNTTSNSTREQFAAILTFVRTLTLSLQTLDSATLATSLRSSLNALKTDATFTGGIVSLIKIEKNAGLLADLMPAGRDAAAVDTSYASLNNTGWIGNVQVSTLTADTTINVAANGATTIKAKGTNVLNADLFSPFVQRLINTVDNLYQSSLLNRTMVEQQLFTQHPWFKGLAARFRRDMALIPASGAMAGVYASVDRTRGVWKAPANVSLNAVVGPAVKLEDRDQESLNIHPTGKSVNVVRAFTGKGVLVWGARTLAGNDNEWKYVPVRRFFIFAEESIRKATEPFVFEPNDANTWVRVKAMVENFLTLQWRAGALAGAKPDQAFYVKVGLNETMTALDILEGRMIVEIGMAAIRPAEFIILRFSHKMQES